MKAIENTNTLFIICPFCQLESYLRAKFGNDIVFMTAIAGVLNFNSHDIFAIKNLIQIENITDIYLVNDIGCNFIKEAINDEKEYGLHEELQLRVMLKDIELKIKSKVLSKEKIKLAAENNVQEQVKYLNTEKILKYEITSLKIKIHTLITNKHESIISKFKLN